MGAQDLDTDAIVALCSPIREHPNGRLAVAVAMEQPGVRDRVAILGRSFAPKLFQDLAPPLDLPGGGEYAGESEPCFRAGVRNRLHDPYPAAAIGLKGEQLDHYIVTGAGRLVPVSGDTTQRPGAASSAWSDRTSISAWIRRAPRFSGSSSSHNPAAPGPPGGKRFASAAMRAARSASRGARCARGGVRVALDRPGDVRFAAPARRELGGEQAPERPGPQSGSGFGTAGRGVGKREHACGKQERRLGGGRDPGGQAPGSHHPLE